MAWSPEFANAELARMRESSLSRAPIGSKKSEITSSSYKPTRTSSYKKKTKRDVERMFEMGEDVDLVDVVDSGAGVPDDYELRGNKFVLKSMLPGGRMGTGSGIFGELTGTDVRGILGGREASRQASQDALISEARGKIASRRSEQDAIKALEQQSILDQMVAREEARKAKLSGTTGVGMGRTERNYRKWAEENPEKAKELELRGASLTLEQEKFIEAKAKTQKQADAISRMDAFIQEHKDDLEFNGIIGELNTVRGAILAGMSMDSATTMIENKLKSAEEKAARKQEEQILREGRSAAEWDRRRSAINSDRIEAERRAEGRRRVNDANKTSYVIQEEINQIQDDMASAQAQISELETLANELSVDPKNAERVTEITNAIQARRVQVSGLQAELSSKQSRAQSPAGGMERATTQDGRVWSSVFNNYITQEDIAALEAAGMSY